MAAGVPTRGGVMSRYEFTFLVTDVELSEEERLRVGRAVAMAGAAELGAALPPEAVSAPVQLDERLYKVWCGIPREVAFPPGVESPEVA
jgi:hypothetical protein